MDRFETGMLVQSKAGHDIGQVYIIINTDDAYVYLADGSIRTLNNLKKKKKKHTQLICTKYHVTDIDDTAIKRILKEFNRERRKQEEI